MKAAPVIRSLRSRGNGVQQRLVHSGQHYDHCMSAVFFKELGLPEPDLFLGVGSGSHAYQITEIMRRLDQVLSNETPDCLLVYGDVNSTLAGALAAARRGLAVGHVEAGLRSFDGTMPEERNRIAVDWLSQWLFAPSTDAVENLQREGISPERIYPVGNVMIDTLLHHQHDFKERPLLDQLGLRDRDYLLVTLHRPCNVDCGTRLQEIIYVLETISKGIPVLFTLHPRTEASLKEHSIQAETANLRLMPPLGYLDFLCLLSRARAVITDSGGVQEESTFLGIPCLTLRANTERPVTVIRGTNRLVGNDPQSLLETVQEIIQTSPEPGIEPVPLWDGHAADRIASILFECLSQKSWVSRSALFLG